MLLSSLLVLAGIALLYAGGEVLISNAIQLARSFGVSSLVIGLTVVAFATSAPELATTITAALRGSPDIAIGNVLGSNIANLALILGFSAVVFPLHTTKRFIRREVLFMVAVTVLIYPLMVRRHYLGTAEGIVLLVGLGLFLILQMWEKGSAPDVAGDDLKQRPVWLAVLGVFLGIGLLVGGAQALVTGATDVARTFGISERIIGLTLVAVGTSLPELSASIVAARRREGDLVLGNVIGSNIFNLLCILGVTALIHPIDIAAQAMAQDYWVVLGVSVAVLAALATQRRLVRLEGAILLAFYLGYMVFLYQA